MQQQRRTPRQGEEVRLGDGTRRYTVIEVSGDQVRCAWFDGRGLRELTAPLARVALASATSDTRVIRC